MGLFIFDLIRCFYLIGLSIFLLYFDVVEKIEKNWYMSVILVLVFL